MTDINTPNDLVLRPLPELPTQVCGLDKGTLDCFGSIPTYQDFFRLQMQACALDIGWEIFDYKHSTNFVHAYVFSFNFSVMLNNFLANLTMSDVYDLEGSRSNKFNISGFQKSLNYLLKLSQTPVLERFVRSKVATVKKPVNVDMYQQFIPTIFAFVDFCVQDSMQSLGVDEVSDYRELFDFFNKNKSDGMTDNVESVFNSNCSTSMRESLSTLDSVVTQGQVFYSIMSSPSGFKKTYKANYCSDQRHAQIPVDLFGSVSILMAKHFANLYAGFCDESQVVEVKSAFEDFEGSFLKLPDSGTYDPGITLGDFRGLFQQSRERELAKIEKERRETRAKRRAAARAAAKEAARVKAEELRELAEEKKRRDEEEKIRREAALNSVEVPVEVADVEEVNQEERIDLEQVKEQQELIRLHYIYAERDSIVVKAAEIVEQLKIACNSKDRASLQWQMKLSSEYNELRVKFFGLEKLKYSEIFVEVETFMSIEEVKEFIDQNLSEFQDLEAEMGN